MRKEFPPFRFAACALCLLSLFALRASAQDGDHKQDKDHQQAHPNGIVQDWSRHHAVYPRVGPIQSLIAVQHDPRAILSWQEAEREDWHRARDREGDGDRDGEHRHSHGTPSGIHRDWSISLGTKTTAPSMYPAKYTFDINATPDCSTDFIVFPVNATGISFVTATGTITSGSTTVIITAGTITPSDVGRQITGAGIPANDTIASTIGNPATSLTLITAATATNAAEALTLPGQPNIVGFSNLYSGTAGSTGICNAPANGRTAGTNDDGVSATTIFSYNITAAGGNVPTSPALSLDGNKIAFVESAASTTAHFHVLAWRSGDGAASNLQTVTSPITITSGFAALAPAAGTGTVTDLALGLSGSDTLSSPFVDYDHDVAYVGNDTGTLFRVKDVFCTLDPACTGGTPPAPSLDASWGSGGALATGCTGVLTGPVVAGTGNIFVGCSDGNLYGFTPGGTSILPLGLTVGNGGPKGGIVDPPLVDAVNGFVYVVSGDSGVSGPSVLIQASATDLSSPVTATLGAGGLFNLHAPAFNEAYFTSPFSSVSNTHGTVNPSVILHPGMTSNWQIYEWAVSGAGSSPDTLYGVGFNSSSHDMTSGPAANFIQITGSTAAEFSPLTHLLNGTTDQLFASALLSSILPPNTIVYNLTDLAFAGRLFPDTFPFPSSAAGTTATEGSGTTGIVVDNVGAQAQASSIYFGALGANTAVKVTQSGLQ